MEKEKEVVTIYNCEICKSRISEKRLKKHHEKVHSGINHDIYRPLTSVTLKMCENNNVPLAAEKPKEIDSVWGFEKPSDESAVHVQCTICNNKMPAGIIEAHMIRKHSEAFDQVDAIGVMTKELDPIIENALAGLSKDVSPFTRNFMDDVRKCPYGTKTTESTAGLIATTSTEKFYNIRISEEQMQEFLDQKRIYPKDGALYLK